MLEIFLGAFATLFVIIDPIGIAPISVSLLDGHSFAQRRRILIGASLIAFVLLVFFGLVGQPFLSAIGIGMPAFRISGGILLFLTALEMLFQKRNERRAHAADEASPPTHDPMVFPLAMPLLAGPGALTTMILLGSEYSGNWAAQGIIFATLALVLVMTVAASMLANRFAHLLGETGTQLINRVFGVLLAALSVQFIADGVTAYVGG